MNRLLIVGNGFDIAHNLKTKYRDYIKYYWQKVKDSTYKDDNIEFIFSTINLNNCKSLNDVTNYLAQYYKGVTIETNGTITKSNGELVMSFHNKFFFRINQRYDEANWVDIEMEYYNNLKEILKRHRELNISESDFNTVSYSRILVLNNEIAQIAKEFESYLATEVVPISKKCFNNEVKEAFSNDGTDTHELDRFYEEFPKGFVDKELRPYYDIKKISGEAFQKFKETYILNFNYTNTINQYFNTNFNSKATIINIHGEINDPSNKVNLGFGDERDKYYAEIEDLNKNEYLRFMKSFHYSNNKNYKKLFDFIEDSNFQIQIMGHSCGLSDRTLLNAIFEHKNCRAIKVYYHKYQQVMNDGTMDNYSEIVKNISRHFNQKTMMRNKIIDRTLCEELSQIENVEKFAV